MPVTRDEISIEEQSSQYSKNVNTRGKGRLVQQ
jgi:hypothetical protein